MKPDGVIPDLAKSENGPPYLQGLMPGDLVDGFLAPKSRPLERTENKSPSQEKEVLPVKVPTKLSFPESHAQYILKEIVRINALEISNLKTSLKQTKKNPDSEAAKARLRGNESNLVKKLKEIEKILKVMPKDTPSQPEAMRKLTELSIELSCLVRIEPSLAKLAKQLGILEP